MLEKEFIDFGYTKEEYEFIRNYHQVSEIKETTLLEKFREMNKFFLEVGYTKEDIIKMCKSYPPLYCFRVENLKQKIKDFMSLGYTKEETLRMTRLEHAIYTCNINTIKQKIKDIMSLGYTRANVIRIAKSYLQIYTLNIETIRKRIEDIMSLGYTKKQVLKMTVLYPQLYSLNIEQMKQKMEDIMLLGYTKDEVLKMTILLPTLYGLNIETIRKKIEFYDAIDIHKHAITSPRNLMQSVALTYARYIFYSLRGVDITIDNCEKLFDGNAIFEHMYGITKEKLIERYNYEEYMSENDILNSTINNMEVYSAVLTKRANFALRCIKASGKDEIDSIETQKEIEKIMMKKMGI